jgi:hypothetical protein
LANGIFAFASALKKDAEGRGWPFFEAKILAGRDNQALGSSLLSKEVWATTC